MPKEETHRRIAEQALNFLDESAVKELILKHSAYYDFGSVAPDTLFNYEVFHWHNRFIKTYRSYAHRRADTLGFLTDYARQALATEEGWSYLFGAVSHVCADVVFHPMVYYFSGYRSADGLAMTRHFHLESLLDMTLITLKGELLPLKNQLKSMDAGRLEGAFNALHFAESPPQNYTAAALKSHAFFESLYNKSLPASLAKLLAPKQQPMFYRPWPPALKNSGQAELIWHKKQNYKKACGGEDFTRSFAELAELAALETARVLNSVGTNFALKKFDALCGANLDTGEVGKPAETMSFFHITDPEALFRL
jgi:hypothetical protein